MSSCECLLVVINSHLMSYPVSCIIESLFQWCSGYKTVTGYIECRHLLVSSRCTRSTRQHLSSADDQTSFVIADKFRLTVVTFVTTKTWW